LPPVSLDGFGISRYSRTPQSWEIFQAPFALDYRITPSLFADRGKSIMASVWKTGERWLHKLLREMSIDNADPQSYQDSANFV
jgi:hypothetical protein